jgi:hypothetical protein
MDRRCQHCAAASVDCEYHRRQYYGSCPAVYQFWHFVWTVWTGYLRLVYCVGGSHCSQRVGEEAMAHEVQRRRRLRLMASPTVVSSRNGIVHRIWPTPSELHCRGRPPLYSVLDLKLQLEAILAKLDSVYGQVDDNADVMASFFSARQGPIESVADWSCRIEGLFGRLRRLSGTAVSTEDLRQMFWTGLR